MSHSQTVSKFDTNTERERRLQHSKSQYTGVQSYYVEAEKPVSDKRMHKQLAYVLIWSLLVWREEEKTQA